MTGILISTNDQEKLCVPEAYSLLNEVSYCRNMSYNVPWPVQYADQMYGPEIISNEGDEDDVAFSLAQEVDRLRGNELKPRRFQAIDSGTKHVVFVQCQPPVDPVGLVHHILSDVLKTKSNKSRYILCIYTDSFKDDYEVFYILLHCIYLILSSYKGVNRFTCTSTLCN